MSAPETGRAAAAVDRLARVEWAPAERELDLQGRTVLPRLLDADQCDVAAGWYGRA